MEVLTKSLESFVFLTLSPAKFNMFVVFRFVFRPKKFPWTGKKSYGRLAGKNWPVVRKIPLKVAKNLWIFFSKVFSSRNVPLGN